MHSDRINWQWIEKSDASGESLIGPINIAQKSAVSRWLLPKRSLKNRMSSTQLISAIDTLMPVSSPYPLMPVPSLSELFSRWTQVLGEYMGKSWHFHSHPAPVASSTGAEAGQAKTGSIKCKKVETILCKCSCANVRFI